MADYLEELRQHARIAILRMLEDAPQHTSNVSMMASLLPQMGIGFTRDQTTSEVNWLKEQGLATVEDHGNFIVATATVRGVEVAQGLVKHPGVKRPRPGS